VEDKLLEKFDFALPEEMLQEHSDDILRRQRLDLQYRGVPLEELDKHSDELAEASRKEAERQFRLHLILEQIAEKERVYATEGDVENEIAMLAANYRVRPTRMRAELEKRRSLGDLRLRIRERKTLDAVMDKASITVEEAAAEPEAEAAEDTPEGQSQE
jgi:FKBP-type peptidyl-prolyl cis-trans isomerase (trigger factor)